MIVPTFGDAHFARWAVKSVQQQAIKDIEICIICDGSPPEMIEFFQQMAAEDLRIRVYSYPKAPRTGEPFRDTAIKSTTGRTICYCSHDDLWLPNHIAAVEQTLRHCCFTHSLHAICNVPEAVLSQQSLLGGILWVNLDSAIRQRMQNGENFFGLTFGAHTRESYFQLPEGWVTTPIPDMPTDLYMWRKFLAAFGDQCQTTPKITALNFRKSDRLNWTEQKRDDELKHWFEEMSRPAFTKQLFRDSLRICPSRLQRFKFFRNNPNLWLRPTLLPARAR